MKLLKLACGLLTLSFWFSWAFLVQYFESHGIRSADPGSGRIFSQESHGSVVYLTASQHYLLYGLMYGSGAFFLLGFILEYFPRKHFRAATTGVAFFARPPSVPLPGEAVIWTGAPPTGIRLRLSDAFDLPFFGGICSFAVFVETACVHVGAPWSWMLLFAPVLLVGVYGTLGRLFVSAALRARTSYTVTDRAAYVARVGWFPAARRYSGRALDAIQYKSKANGIGTIRFVSLPRMLTFREGWGSSNDIRLDGFEDIADAQHVLRLITDARAK